MAGFFSNLFDKITSIFKSKDLDSNISNFENKINQIIKDLIEPYANPTALEPEDRFRDMLLLLNPKQCNKIAITLSNNLDKNYTKLQLEQFANAILVGKSTKDCNDDTCTNNAKPDIANKNSKVSKKEICNSIAVHYVKILNVICAILTAVNPADNICLNRLRNLITIINEDTKEGLSGICSVTDNTVKNSIMHEPGFRELLLLYYYHLVQDTETDEEKTNVRNQYQMLVQTFSNLVMFVDKSFKNKNNNNIMIQKELAKESKRKTITSDEEEEEEPESEENQSIKGDDNEISSYINNMRRENSMKNKNKNNNQLEPKQPAATSDNIASLRKNITNFKEEENQKLQRIINNIDGLSKIITEIQQRNSSKPSNNQPTMNQYGNTSSSTLSNVNMNNMPNTNEDIPTTNTNTEISPNTNTSKQPISTISSNQPQEQEESEQPPPSNTESIDTSNTTTSSITDSPTVISSNTITPQSNIVMQPTSTPSAVSAPVASAPVPVESAPVPVESAPVTAATPTPVESAPATANIPPVKNNSTSKNSMTSSTSGNNTGKAIQEINRLLKEYESEQPKQSGGANNNQSRSSNSMSNNSITRNNRNNRNNNNNKEKTMENNEDKEESIRQELEEEAENQRNEDLYANITNENQNNKLNQSNINDNNVNPYLQKFKEFVNLYNKVDKLDDKILEIVNTAFKTYNKFSSDNPNEMNMYINPDEFDKFCKNNANQLMLIPIKLDDPRLGEFIKIYKDLKNVYLDNCEYLLKLLDDKILMKTAVIPNANSSASTTGNQEEAQTRFTLQNIGYSDLTEIETDVRNHLVKMYSQCHEYYQKAFVSIYKGLSAVENK
jgi:hypothetical protein